MKTSARKAWPAGTSSLTSPTSAPALAAALLAVALAAGCGGGGSSTAVSATPEAPAAPSPAVAGYTVSGTMAVTETSAVDSDTNDPAQPGRADNGSFETLQPLPNPVQLIGYLTLPGEGPSGPASDTGDLVDGYRLYLEAGQVVELEFSADPARLDIDLFIYDANRDLTGASTGLNKYECVRITTSGDYSVGVQLFSQGSSGGSIYQLRIGAPGTGTACANVTGAAQELVAGQIVAEPSAATRERLAAGTKSLEDVVVLRGDPAATRPVLVQVPAGADAQGAGLQRLQAAGSAGGSGSGRLAKGITGNEPVTTQTRAWRSRMSARTLDLHQTIEYAKSMVASGAYRHAVPNFRVKATQTLGMAPFPPNDREYVKQRWHYEAINLPGAVASLQGLNLAGSRRPIVAVVDTGIVGNHPDLANQLVRGYDFVSDAVSAGDGGGADGDPDDASVEQGFSFHGSHVAGTVAAQTYNGIGGAGVAPIARIMPVRVLGTEGAGSLYDIVQGVRFAAGLETDAGVTPERAADVINLSLGANTPCDPLLQELFNAVRARGTMVVAAAGNESQAGLVMPVSFPANCASVFGVAATDALGRRAPYSNVGAENFVAAPGGDTSQSTTGSGLPDGIYSTMAGIDSGGSRQPTYGLLQGTSMATPHVAGVLALMRWVNPALSPRAIEDLATSGAIVDDLGSPGRDNIFGHGLINARKAVDAAIALSGGGVSPPPPPAAGQTQAQPSSISLGSIRTEAEFVLAHVGATDERVVSVTADSPVISVAPKPEAVDPATGLGTYRVQANRAAMAVGTSAFPNVVVRLSSGRTLTVQVAVERRATTAAQGDLGPIYLLVLDAGDPLRAVVADTIVSAPVGGFYRYSVTVPGTAAISIIAGSDINNNGGICSTGEACGAYPMLSSEPQVLRPDGNLDGIDFNLLPYGGISPDAASEVMR